MGELARQLDYREQETDFDLEDFIQKRGFDPKIEEIIRKYDYIQEAIKIIIKKLDEYQLNHIAGVAEKCLFLSKEFNLSEKDANILLQASFLHDVGKTQDDEIIRLIISNDRFSEDEEGRVKREKINEHPNKTRDWCREKGVPNEIMYVAVGHHEYENDGKSHPRHRVRNEVDENLKYLKRIFSLVDRYDAWKNKRSYKEALSAEDCEREMEKNGIKTEDDKKIIRILVKNDKNN